MVIRPEGTLSSRCGYLSACETAFPDLRASEQLISFPTGLLLGGAAHVFATLWPITNAHATAVNHVIYRQLATDLHPAEALRHALREIRGAGAPSDGDHPLRALAADDQTTAIPFDHPFWWALFIHHGSPW